MDEKRASEKELKGFEAPVSGNGWQFPVREEKMSFFFCGKCCFNNCLSDSNSLRIFNFT